MLIAGFDPGVNTVGFSILEVGTTINKPIKVVVAKNFECSNRKKDWNVKVLECMSNLDGYLFDRCHTLDIKYGYSEEPVIMGGARGISARGRNDVSHLAFSMGIFAYSITMQGGKFSPISIQGWKGTLSDEIVWNRVQRVFTQPHDQKGNKLESHNLDAIGIAICGHFKTDMRNNLWGST